MLWLMTWRDKIVSETKAVSTRAKCNRLCLSWPYRKPHVSDIGDIKQEDCSVLIFFGAPWFGCIAACCLKQSKLLWVCNSPLPDSRSFVHIRTDLLDTNPYVVLSVSGNWRVESTCYIQHCSCLSNKSLDTLFFPDSEIRSQNIFFPDSEICLQNWNLLPLRNIFITS